ncbi:Retrovirus-related Pol polyprotein from transposon TNT 1-94 [Ceratobasidium sp. AG-Ba]|nr:Retrovirus-related Pol polyprotein from transposon TNT 1-94 [Ceratobasidium sp. AG-Ba]
MLIEDNDTQSIDKVDEPDTSHSIVVHRYQKPDAKTPSKPVIGQLREAPNEPHPNPDAEPDFEPGIEVILELEHVPAPPRRSGRMRRPPERYGAQVGAFATLEWVKALNAVLEAPPQSFDEATNPTDANLCIVAALDLELLQVDIKLAFLHDDMDEEIFMEQPDSFVVGKGHLWKPRNQLYGLKKAARAFYLRLMEILDQMGFKRRDTDHVVFYKRDGDEFAIILPHVDDMLLAGTSIDFLEQIEADLAK